MNKTKANLNAKRITSHAKKMYDSKSRMFLQKCWERDGKYYFSDGYRAIRFDKNWEFEIENDESETVKECKDKIVKAFEVEKKYQMRCPSIDEVKEQIKEQKEAKIKIPFYVFKEINGGEECKVNAGYLKDMIELFGEGKVWFDGKWTVQFEDNGVEGVLMGIKRVM